jgi:hypothetical protein
MFPNFVALLIAIGNQAVQQRVAPVSQDDSEMVDKWGLGF